jgi:hypothetical protein
MGDSIGHTKKATVKALEQSLGVVSVACRAVGISRDTHYRWLKEDEGYKAEVEALAEVALDFAESSLHKLIQEGVPSATIFYLKTKGKRRGYVETQDIHVTAQASDAPPWFDIEE